MLSVFGRTALPLIIARLFSSGLAAGGGQFAIRVFAAHVKMECEIVCKNRIKNWERPWKLGLIEKANPEWRDLASGLGFPPLA